jgi:hypothetical protein
MQLQIGGHVVRDPVPIWRQYAQDSRARFVNMTWLIPATRTCSRKRRPGEAGSSTHVLSMVSGTR